LRIGQLDPYARAMPQHQPGGTFEAFVFAAKDARL
jgi:hypothetical protein